MCANFKLFIFFLNKKHWVPLAFLANLTSVVKPIVFRLHYIVFLCLFRRSPIKSSFSLFLSLYPNLSMSSQVAFNRPSWSSLLLSRLSHIQLFSSVFFMSVNSGAVSFHLSHPVFVRELTPSFVFKSFAVAIYPSPFLFV